MNKYQVGDIVHYIFGDHGSSYQIVADKKNPRVTETMTTVATKDYVIVKVPILDFSPFIHVTESELRDK